MTDETSADRAAHEPDLNLLAAHRDGRLGPEESADLVAHLAECRTCRQTAALMARALSAESARRSVLPVTTGWLAIAATLVLASIVGIRISRDRSSPVLEPEPAPRPSAPSAAPPSSETSAPAMAPAAEPPDVKRGGERKVAGKTFRLVLGEWVDRSYDPTAALPVVQVSDPEARRKLLAEQPQLVPYLGLGNRVLVVLDGTVYRFGPPSS